MVRRSCKPVDGRMGCRNSRSFAYSPCGAVFLNNCVPRAFGLAALARVQGELRRNKPSVVSGVCGFYLPQAPKP